MKIDVTCYSGYRGEQTPQTIHFDSRAIAVATVLDQWLAPDHRYFKILGEDNVVYIVRHDNDRGWELTLMEKRRGYLDSGEEVPHEH